MQSPQVRVVGSQLRVPHSPQGSLWSISHAATTSSPASPPLPALGFEPPPSLAEPPPSLPELPPREESSPACPSVAPFPAVDEAPADPDAPPEPDTPAPPALPAEEPGEPAVPAAAGSREVRSSEQPNQSTIET